MAQSTQTKKKTTKNTNKNIVICSLAFSSSIMLFISILDLIPESIKYLNIKKTINKTQNIKNKLSKEFIILFSLMRDIFSILS